MNRIAQKRLPIAVFDSGVGGLTVLKALWRALPHEDFVYLGDTARVPYGTKSAASVVRYAEQAVQALVDRQVKALVVACNTASAVAVDRLRVLHPELIVEGVVEPGARAACSGTRSGKVAVIATEGTIQGAAYQRAIASKRPDIQVAAGACSLFVTLAEEGWVEGELLEQVIDRYLAPVLDPQRNGGIEAIDCLILGCTHFPVLKGAIANVVGEGVGLVDSASTTAELVRARLRQAGLVQEARAGTTAFLVTDGPERFVRVAETFLGSPISDRNLSLVDIQGYQVP